MRAAVVDQQFSLAASLIPPSMAVSNPLKSAPAILHNGLVQGISIDTTTTRAYPASVKIVTQTVESGLSDGGAYMCTGLSPQPVIGSWMGSLWAKTSFATTGKIFGRGTNATGNPFLNSTMASIDLTTEWQHFMLEFPNAPGWYAAGFGASVFYGATQNILWITDWTLTQTS